LRSKTDGFLKGLVYDLERESDKKIIDVVEKIAKSKGKSMAQIAVAYSLRKVDAPIVGLNKVERIHEM
jgi:versiconal hemiacetal acetate reductase